MAMNAHGGYVVMSARKRLLADRIERLSLEVDSGKYEKTMDKLEEQLHTIHMMMQRYGWKEKECMAFFAIRKENALKRGEKSSAAWVYDRFLDKHFPQSDTPCPLFHAVVR